MNHRIVILTGASGAGKTTLAQAVQSRQPADCDFLFFDSIGVPSFEEMIEEYGSLEKWQRAKTIAWMPKLSAVSKTGRKVLFEGQMRLAFIQKAVRLADIQSALIVLIDCDDEIRTHRLALDRKQPELANPQMMNWARYLRHEAESLGCEILDTGVTPFETCVSRVLSYLSCSSEKLASAFQSR